MSRISLSKKDAQTIAQAWDLLPSDYVTRSQFGLAFERLRMALKPRNRPMPLEAKKKAAERRQAHKDETSAIYEAVRNRAGSLCECGCGTPFQEEGPDAPQMDHFWGRGRAPQTVQNCWMLTVRHHTRKGASDPSREHWLKAFLNHCSWWKYHNEVAKAARKLESLALSAQSAEAGKGAR